MIGCIGGIGIFISRTAVEVTIADAFSLQALKENLNPLVVFAELVEQLWERGLAWSLKNPYRHHFLGQIKHSRFAYDLEFKKADEEFLFFVIALKSAQDCGELVSAPIEIIQDIIFSFLTMALEGHEDHHRIYFQFMMRTIFTDSKYRRKI